MTTWQLIRAMIHKGFTLELAPHLGYRGYYAHFRPTTGWLTCPDDWKLVGHGMTLHRAVVMAAKIALGKPVTIPLPEKFK